MLFAYRRLKVYLHCDSFSRLELEPRLCLPLFRNKSEPNNIFAETRVKVIKKICIYIFIYDLGWPKLQQNIVVSVLSKAKVFCKQCLHGILSKS